MDEELKANAEMVVEMLSRLSDNNFGYNPESVKWLEGYIERIRTSGDFENEETKEKLTGVFGSYLGECVIRCYGGAWARRDGVLCVAFDDQNAVFPFAKVAKQFDHGLEDGIAGFFNSIPIVFENLPGPEPLPRHGGFILRREK